MGTQDRYVPPGCPVNRSCWLWGGADCLTWAGVPGWQAGVREFASFAHNSGRPLLLQCPTVPPSKAFLHLAACPLVLDKPQPSVSFRGVLCGTYIGSCFKRGLRSQGKGSSAVPSPADQDTSSNKSSFPLVSLSGHPDRGPAMLRKKTLPTGEKTDLNLLNLTPGTVEASPESP